MRTKLITLVFVLLTINAFGYGNRSSCPKIYLGPSLGINNTAGILGIAFDVPVTSQFSLGTGLGISSWGFKTYGEGRFYFRECNRGFAFGTGATYNTGIQNLSLDLTTTSGTQAVGINLEPTANLFLNAYHFFSMGSRHRFYLQLGYSYALNDKPYSLIGGQTLDADGEQAMQILRPGGVSFGFGFSFGIGGR